MPNAKYPLCVYGSCKGMQERRTKQGQRGEMKSETDFTQNQGIPTLFEI